MELKEILPNWEQQEAELPDWLAGVQIWKGYINAEDAARFLERNIEPEIGKGGTNRRSQPFLVEKFLDVLMDHKWRFTHQGVAFNDKGQLIDGAHRLKALRLTAEVTGEDIHVPIIVAINIPSESADVIDVTRRRSVSDMLTMRGYANGVVMGAAVRLIHLFANANFEERGTAYWSHSCPPRDEMLAWVDNNRADIIEAVRIGNNSQTITHTAVAAGYYICRKKHPEVDIDLFLHGLNTGEDLRRGDPVLALRNWAINQRTDGHRAIAYEHLAMFLKAFKAFREGRPVQILSWRPAQEGFPRP